MMVCQACGSENPDGSIFCSNCSRRIVIASSDLNIGETSPEEPLIYESRRYGKHERFSKGGFVARIVPAALFTFAFSAILIIGGLSRTLMPEAVYIGLILMAFMCLTILVNRALIARYRKVGRPLNFGGEGQGLPSASRTMEAEDDMRKRTDVSSGEAESVSARDRMVPRR